MTYPNTLIFVDLASDDPEATGKFYADVFGWTNEGRPAGSYHRLVPGRNFLTSDGNEGPTGNLHIGIFNSANQRPHPNADSVGPRPLARGGAKARIWVLVSDDDSAEAILERATSRGATELWRNHYWKEFNGYNAAFEDPWGNEIVMWIKAGPEPKIPEDFTRE
ncbi:MAG: glyoxalase [Sphingomonas sp. SCN 67-18]|uniref:VOC family protein n=1 Tax=uncultured Sphingomonas sp. TaxID=158754 RepID=UPI000868A8DC|nr:VOC family protein [Sphingomonas sp. SCN 67-18]ODU20108.1 MAG: glyoxalase [Sphingomonas sp. SCN 67-18]